MKPTLQVGNAADVTITVTREMCPAFDSVVVHYVYSTWSMAHHMELAARAVLAPHLDEDEEGIGSHLSIDHIAPTPMGHTVRVHAEATELSESTLVCDITAYHVHRDGSESVVGRGKQVQRVLPKEKLRAIIERASK